MRPRCGIAGLAVLLIAGLPLQARDQPLPVAPRDRLVVLPVEFAYYKYGTTGSIEMILDKTELAQGNLEASLQRALKRDQSQQFVSLPQLNADEQAIVNEHTDLLRLLAAASTADILERSARSSGYGIGTGLAFLAERAGVDRAIFVSGIRGDPSVDVAVMATAAFVFTFVTEWLIIPGGGNKKLLSAVVVDLRTGDVLQNIVPERGFAGEPDDVAGANTWMRALFDITPDRVRRTAWLSASPRPERPVRHPRPRKGFVVTAPIGWGESDNFHTMCLYRHRPGIESICVDNKLLGDALRARETTPDVEPMKVGEIAVGVVKADERFAEMVVTSLIPARIAGHDGFRAELASHLNLAGSHIRERHVVYGFAGGQGAFLVRFDAPAIYYFDRYLPEFEAMVGTFRLMK
jgi:hypothetical protein